MDSLLDLFSPKTALTIQTKKEQTISTQSTNTSNYTSNNAYSSSLANTTVNTITPTYTYAPNIIINSSGSTNRSDLGTSNSLSDLNKSSAGSNSNPVANTPVNVSTPQKVDATSSDAFSGTPLSSSGFDLTGIIFIGGIALVGYMLLKG